VNLHFGVYDGSLQFNIEQCGYNLKDFGIPDMRGYIGNNECIEEDCKIGEGR
jgi:pyrrolidone-carboxylate peptidase